MATIEERTKEIDELYAKATSQEEYHQVWELAQGIEIELNQENRPVNEIAKAIINGYWARYYEVRKFERTKENIDSLCQYVRDYFEAIDRQDIELAVNYGYLLSVIVGQLKEDLEGASEMDEEVQQLVKETGNIALGLRVINARGLNAIQKKDWPEAIEIFTRAEQRFPEAPTIPEARQHLGNTMNNRGLAKLHLSDGVKEIEAKKEMIKSGVWDLLAAMNLYFMVPLIPQKHLEGIRNRLRLARDKAQEVDSDLVQAIEIFLR